MGQARINVLIVTYKQADVIGRNIESILQQKEFGLNKIVISDDCSPDNNWDVIQSYVQKYPEYIIAYRNNPNLGIYGNSNKLASLCGEADLYCWLEGDDALCDGFFKSMQEFIKANNIDLTKPIGILSDYYAIAINGSKNRCRNYNVSKKDKPYGLFLRGRATWRASLFTASIIKQFTPVECNQGLSLAETLFDSQWFKYAERCYYNPIVGSIYYTGLGVSVNWNLSDHFSVYHTTDYIKKWEYMIENGLLVEEDDICLGVSKVAYTKCLLKFSIKDLWIYIRNYIKGTKNYGVPIKYLIRQTLRVIVLSLIGNKKENN